MDLEADLQGSLARRIACHDGRRPHAFNQDLDNETRSENVRAADKSSPERAFFLSTPATVATAARKQSRIATAKSTTCACDARRRSSVRAPASWSTADSPGESTALRRSGTPFRRATPPGRIRQQRLPERRILRSPSPTAARRAACCWRRRVEGHTLDAPRRGTGPEDNTPQPQQGRALGGRSRRCAPRQAETWEATRQVDA